MITNGKKEWIPELSGLWVEAFQDETSYINLFYQYHFQEETIWCYEEEEKPVAVIYGMNALMWRRERGGFKKIPVTYYYAGATKKTSRGKGYYGELMKSLKPVSNQVGIPFLVPVKHLIPYYEKQGFYFITQEEDRVVEKVELQAASFGDVKILEKELDAIAYKQLRDQMLGREGYIEWDTNYLEFAIKSNGLAGGFTRKVILDEKPYVIMGYKEGNVLKIIETTLSLKELSNYQQLFYQYFTCESIVVKGCVVMSKDPDFSEDTYLRIILD